MLLSVLVLVSGCGFPPADPVLIRLQLPGAVAKRSPRYQRLLTRVNRLEVVTEPGERDTKSFNFAPGEWERLEIEEATIPKRPGERLTIAVKMWGAKPEPILSGKGEVPEGAKEVTVKLLLRVPAAELD